jgi:hypothetical protein
MSERPPLSRLDDSEESRVRANFADGVPEHLRDHLHVPDKEVFSLKAQLRALRTALESAEKQRDEALRVAASATARCDSLEEHATTRLDKARTLADTAQRSAEASERRADLGEKTAAMVERRAKEAEAQLEEMRRLAEDLRNRVDEQATMNASLEDEVTVFRARVIELECGVPTRSRGTQTTAEDAAAAARADDRDGIDPAQVGVRANASRWLRELESVGTPPSLDTVSGTISRATARNHFTPPGLGIDLAPPAVSTLISAAGYTRSQAARVAAFVVERDIIPAVDKMFSRRLPLRFEIRALLAHDVEPFVALGIERRHRETDPGEAVNANSAEDAGIAGERDGERFAGGGSSSAYSHDDDGSEHGEALHATRSKNIRDGSRVRGQYVGVAYG